MSNTNNVMVIPSSVCVELGHSKFEHDINHLTHAVFAQWQWTIVSRVIFVQVELECFYFRPQDLQASLQPLSIATHFFTSVPCCYCTASTESKIPLHQKSQENWENCISKLDFKTLFYRTNLLFFKCASSLVLYFIMKGNGNLSKLEEARKAMNKLSFFILWEKLGFGLLIIGIYQ